MDLITNILDLFFTSRPIIYKSTNLDTQMYIHYCKNFKYITLEEWNLIDNNEKQRSFFIKKRQKI
jgi:hypothetical protein